MKLVMYKDLSYQLKQIFAPLLAPEVMLDCSSQPHRLSLFQFIYMIDPSSHKRYWNHMCIITEAEGLKSDFLLKLLDEPH